MSEKEEPKAVMAINFTIYDDGKYQIKSFGVNNDLELIAVVEIARNALLSKTLRDNSYLGDGNKNPGGLPG